MSESTAKRTYGLLDVVKFIMSIFVITIHRRIGSDSNFLIFEEVNVLARLAVPFFFTSSSFLFFSKLNRVENRSYAFEKYEFRLLRLFVIWNLIYIPSSIYRAKFYFKYSWTETISEILHFSNHLWFLPVLAMSVAAIYYGVQKKPKITGIVSAVLFILSILAGFGKFYLHNPTDTVYFLLSGIPYVFLGYLIAGGKKIASLKASVIIFAVSIILSLTEGYIEFNFLENTYFGFSRLFYLPAIYSLISICLNVQTKERKIFLTLRKLSMFIYFIHLIVYQEMIWLLFHIAGFDELYKNNFTVFVFTLFYVAAACILLLLLEDKKGFRWLKNLY